MTLKKLENTLKFSASRVNELTESIRSLLKCGLNVPRFYYKDLIYELSMVVSIKRMLVVKHGKKGRYVASLY